MEEKSENQKQVCGIAGYLLLKNTEKPLPSHSNLAELVDKFADFFASRLKKLWDSFDISSATP